MHEGRLLYVCISTDLYPVWVPGLSIDPLWLDIVKGD